MDDTLSELISKLYASILDENFIDLAYDIIEEIETRDDAFDAVGPILELMEKNADKEFGRPGPLVHFVERYYRKGYEDKLIESLRRAPTKHTLWMFNRLINGSEGDVKQYYLNIIDEISNTLDLESDVVELARHFRSLHV